MERRTSYEIISEYVAGGLRSAMEKVPQRQLCDLTEIRLRTMRPVAFVYPDRIKFLTSSGTLTTESHTSGLVITTPEEIAAIVNALCRYSAHSCQRELHEGYFVIQGGIRAGICGTVSQASDGLIRNISSINFRISREVISCAEEIFNRFYSSSGGLLICGGVNSGKTTLLRDLCRLCGNRSKVTLIDERNEISASIAGIPEMNIGTLTDVIVGGERSKGIISAVRVMSPEFIFCDELSTESDVQAILSAYGCGVRFAATVHAKNLDDLRKRKVITPLIDAAVFTHAVFLGSSAEHFKIMDYRRLGDAY